MTQHARRPVKRALPSVGWPLVAALGIDATVLLIVTVVTGSLEQGVVAASVLRSIIR